MEADESETRQLRGKRSECLGRCMGFRHKNLGFQKALCMVKGMLSVVDGRVSGVYSFEA
jgi:hypothetical protein